MYLPTLKLASKTGIISRAARGRWKMSKQVNIQNDQAGTSCGIEGDLAGQFVYFASHESHPFGDESVTDSS
jgi:hypothetical protein